MKPVYPQNNPQVCPPFSLENQRFALVAHADGAMNESGPGSATNAHPGPDHSEPYTEVRTMADTSQYPDSGTANKSEQPANWKPIGILARALAERAAKAVAGE